MPTKNITSFVCLMLTAAMLMSSLGVGLISAPADALAETPSFEDVPNASDDTASETGDAFSKDGVSGYASGSNAVSSAQGGWNIQPNSGSWGNWSYRDAHNVPEAADMGYTGDGVIVAVADTGIDFGAQNLEGKYIVDNRTFTAVNVTASAATVAGQDNVTLPNNNIVGGTLKILVNGTLTTAYTVVLTSGVVTFGSALPVGSSIVCSYDHRPYYGWPVAFDAYGLPEFLLAKEAKPGMGGITNTTLNGTGPFDVDHTIKVDGQRDFSRNELIGSDKPKDIKTKGTASGLEFDLTELFVTRDDTFWYSGLRTSYGAMNRTFGFAYDFDGAASGSTKDPRGNLLDFNASHSAPIEQVAYSAAKGLIASCAAIGADPAITSSYDINSVKVWGESGNLVRSLPIESTPVFSVAWSPNGNYLAYTTGIEVVVYNTNTWEEAYRITHSSQSVQTYYRESMCFSPNGTMLAVGSIEASNRIQMLNVLTGSQTQPIVPQTTTSVAYSPDGWSIALGQVNGKVQLLNSTTYKFTSLLENEDGRAVETLAWAPGNDYIATGRSTSGNIEIWDLNDGNNSFQWGDGASVIEGIVLNNTLGRNNTLDRFWFGSVQDEMNVNSLTGYNLSVSPSYSSLRYSPLMPNAPDFTWGMRVWLRDAAGIETELTSGYEAVVYRDMDGSGTQEGFWTPPVTSLLPTDSLVVRLYQGPGLGSMVQFAEFTTCQLGELDSDIIELGNTIPNQGELQWKVDYQTRKNTASVDTVMTGGHGISSTVNVIKWTNTKIITGSEDGKIIVWNPATYTPTNTYNSYYNSPILSFDMKSSGEMFVGSRDCTVRKYPAGWGAPTSFAAHKPDLMVYIRFEKEYYDKSGKLIKESKLGEPDVYRWNPTSSAWDKTNITNIFGDVFYKGFLAGEWTEFGYIELAVPRNYTAWPNQNLMCAMAFSCGDNSSRPMDTVPSDCNVPSPSVENWVDWTGTRLVTIGSWGKSEIPTVRIAHSEIVSVRPVDNRTCHFGYHPSEALTEFFGTAVPLIVTESTTLGVWDRVYVDMNADFVIDSNDPYIDKSNPVLRVDIWNHTFNTTSEKWETPSGKDGVPDVSGGFLYFIADGVNLMPYTERVNDHLVEAGRVLMPFGTADNPWNIPKNGEVLAFFGDFDYDEMENRILTSGTQTASAIAGEGLNKGTAVIQGVSPDVKFLPICNAHYDLPMALNFAIEGYDGAPQTGDEAQIIAIGPYTTGYGNGLDSNTQLVEYLVSRTNNTAVFISPAGNDGSGYGTVAAPCGKNTLVVGFAEDNTLVPAGGGTHHTGDVSELSSRGPTAAGLAKPDVIALGIGEVDMPLGTNSKVGGDGQYVLWRGSELASAVTTGVMAMVFEAYKLKHGTFPTTQTAMDIIRSSAKDLGHDPMTQGAGFVDALAAVRLANGAGGLKVTAPKTAFGNTFGVSYDSFINVLEPGQKSNLTVTLSNPGTKLEQTAYGFEYLGRIDLQETTQIVHSWEGYKGDISHMIPAETEVVKVTAQTNYTWAQPWEDGTGADIKNFMALGGSFFMTLWDWVDAQSPGQPGYGEIDDEDDLSYLTGHEYGYVNSMICTLSNPHGNLAGKLVVEIQPDTAAGSGMQSRPWNIIVESFATQSTTWFSTSKPSAGIVAGGTDKVNVSVNVPANAQAGTYAGSFVSAYDPKSDIWTDSMAFTALAENEYLNTTLETTAWDNGADGNYWGGDLTTPHLFDVGKTDNFPLATPAETYSGSMTPSTPISITGNGGFNARSTMGDGSLANPWIIENREITGAGNGIYIANTNAHFIIRNCAIHGMTLSGIYLNNVTNGVIRDVEIYDNDVNCLLIANSDNITAEDISVHDSLGGYGIYIDNSNDIVLSNVAEAGCLNVGFYMVSSSNISMLGCSVQNQDWGIEGYGMGLWLLWVNYSDIVGNTFYGDSYGIFMQGSNQNEISNNVFDGFDSASGFYSIMSTATDLGDPCTNNVITGNDFINCVATHAYDDGTDNDWDGNYWETSYGIDGGSADNDQQVNPVAGPVSLYTARAPITIIGNESFTPANGVVGGNGSADNPFIIARWDINTTTFPHGIWIQDTSAHFLVMDCNIYGNATGYGIVLLNATNGTVRTNKMSSLGTGIHVQNTTGFRLYCNEMSGLTAGIALLGSGNGEVRCNRIDSPVQGIHMNATAQCSIRGNQISGSSLAGIFLVSSDSNTIKDNTVSGGTADGILIKECMGCTVTYNNLDSNGYGIHLANSTGIHMLHHNNFFGNVVHAYDDFPGDSLASFDIYSHFGEPANFTHTYDVLFCNVTRNGIPLIPSTDYTIDNDTGLIVFTPTQLGQPGGVEISVKAVLIFEETVNIFKLTYNRLVGVPNVFINVTGSDGKPTYTMAPGSYTVHLKTGIIELASPLSVGRGLTVWVSYAYYNRTGIVPMTLNVVTGTSASFEYGNLSADENALGISIMPTWGVRTGQGASLVSGDRRYFYVNIPNQGLFSISELINFYLYSELIWNFNQTDINIVVYGKGATASYSSPAPYVMDKVGGSEEKADFSFFTATDGPKDILVTKFTHEILAICVSSKTFNGTNNALAAFQGKNGWIRLSDNNPKAWTNDVVGHLGISFQSSLDMDGITASIVGPAQGTKSVESIKQDDLTLFDLSTLEGWLTMNAVAGFSKVVTVENALSWDVHIMGHPECVDLDLALFYDGKDGQPKDGVAQWREIITTKDMQFDAYKDNWGSGSYCYCADADADEAIKIISPWDGDYIIKVLGYTVTTDPGYFDLEIKSIFAGVEGYKLSHADTDFEDMDATSGGYSNYQTVNGFDIRTFDVLWTFPEGTEDNVYGGIFVLGIPTSPNLIVIAIDINLDREAPDLFPGNTGPNTIVSTKTPTISAKVEDLAKGEIDPNSARVEFDGKDITDIAQISIGLTKNSAETKGYWTGDIIYNPLSPLSEGGHFISVEVKDKAGNPRTASWGFTVDTTDPGMRLSNDQRDIYTSIPNYRLSGSTEPNSAVSIIGVQGTVSQYLDNTFDIDLSLEEGPNFIAIRCTDLAGNTHEATKTITLDTDIPEFSRIVALDGSTTNRRTTGIYGEMTEPGTLEINTMPVPVNSDGTFRHDSISLIEGRNMQRLEFTDRAGNVAHYFMNITLDTVIPVLNIDDMDSVVDTEWLNITGTTEANVASLTINGKLVDVSAGGGFQNNIRISPGVNTIVVEVKDRAGNSAQEVLTVVYAEKAGVNGAAIGLMVCLLIVGLVLGILLAPIILKKDEVPPEEAVPELEGEPSEEEGEPGLESEDAESGPESEEIEPVPELEEVAAEEEGAIEPETDVQPEEAAEELPADQDLEPIPEEEAAPEPLPEEPAAEAEDPRIIKLKEAYESGKISKELYEKNLARFKGE